MIVLIDNYDSFVHNLARHIRLLGYETTVLRNDAVTVDEVRRLNPQAVIISPGPGGPEDAGISLELVRSMQGEIPLLGVCLGHQVIGQTFGATIVPAPVVMHGRTSVLKHDGKGLFAGLPQQLTVCRYHSLVIEPESLHGTNLIPTAWSKSGTVMAIRHREKPIYGIQFHPEAILTDAGPALLQNFLQTLAMA